MTPIGTPLLWAGFLAFVLAMLAIDLGLFHRKAHAVGVREALIWSGVWVGLSLLFNAGLWWKFGSTTALEFFTAYLVEKSLSVDNVFVFLAVFSALAIPAVHQHRVLFWGILSALALRAGMIFAGTAALARFEWLVYVFGLLLVITGARLFLHRGRARDPLGGPVTRAVRRLIPATSRLDGGRFFTLENGRRLATPLFTALVVIELADVVFAVDSIPVVLGITRDPFIVFTSNVFAMLGLRSLFFLLAGAVDRFAYLEVGLSAVLVFVGVKMALVHVVEVPALVSLAVIVAILGASMLASLRRPRAPRPLATRAPAGAE
ncbi:MAG TPA: TerC family protein [Myxococcales bacterium]